MFSAGQFMYKINQCALLAAVRASALFILVPVDGGRSPKSAKARLCASKAPSPNETKEWTGDDASIPFYLHPTLTT